MPPKKTINRRKITIHNSTTFDSRVIRTLVLAVARRELKSGEFPTMVVSVKHPKRNYVTGKATVNPGANLARFTVLIPKTHTDVVEVCHRIKICLDYVKGRHGGKAGVEFHDYWHHKGKAVNYPFAKKYVLAQAAPKAKKKLVGAAGSLKKAEAAQDKVHYWERKVKHATTMLRKYRKLLKYHANRGERLNAEEAAKLEQTQGMTVEEFLKIPPVQLPSEKDQ